MFKGVEVVLGKKGTDFGSNFELLTKANSNFANVPESATQLMKYWLDEAEERPETVQLNPDNALPTLVTATALSPLSLSDLLPDVFNVLVQEECYDEPDRLQFFELVERFASLRQPFLITVVGPTDPNGIALQARGERQLVQFAVG